MRKLLLIVGLLLATHFTYASGINTKGDPVVSGNVVDASTKKPIAEVTITAIHAISKIEHTLVTDCNGNFKINQLPIGNYKLKFEKDNYRTLEKNNITVKQETTTKLCIEIVNFKDEDFEDRRNWNSKFDF